MKVQVI